MAHLDSTRQTQKQCNRCLAFKPLADFQQTQRDGYSAGCKVCLNAEQNARYRLKHPSPPRDVTEQRCTGCGNVKPLEEFAHSAMGRYGRASRCKVCRKREAQQRAERNLAQCPSDEEGHRVCVKCGLDKPLARFRRNRYAPSGRTLACKACLNTQQNARNRELPERRRRYSEQAKERYASKTTPEHKVCRGCRVRKPAAAFSGSHYAADRLRARCKECEARDARLYAADHRAERAAYARAWYSKNRPWARARARVYAAAHPDQVREWARQSYQRHREDRLAREREDRAKNPERTRERGRRYYQTHKEQHAAYSQLYYQAHRDALLIRVAQWRKEHPQQVRDYQRTHRRKHLLAFAAYARLRAARRRAAEGSHTAIDIAHIYEQQQGRCYYCARALGPRWHVDHKQPVSKGGSEWPSNLAATCIRCNTSKGAKTEEEFKALLAQAQQDQRRVKSAP